jgi:hypothetical protein
MEEVLLTDSYTIVDPVVARLLSLAVKAVDEDGDGRFERLDVTAELDVFDPGDYALGFSITSAGRKPNLPAGRWMTLGQGRQTITVSLSGKYVWSELRDGPFLISGVWVLRSGGANSVKVPPTDTQVRTEAWKREQWNPGRVYGDDTVRVRGIRPASSGRFRFAEVQWEVTTPGGQCFWNGSLGGARTLPATQPQSPDWASVYYSGSLPVGRTPLSFIFDAALIAVPGKRDWDFSADIRCGPDAMRVHPRPPDQSLSLEPDQYEPARTSFSIQGTNPIRLPAGGSASTGVYIVNAPQNVRVRFDSIPNGLEAKLSSPTRRANSVEAAVAVQVMPDTRPGRYVIEISAESGTETARRELLVDVTGK